MNIDSRKIKNFIVRLSNFKCVAHDMGISIQELKDKINGKIKWSKDDLAYIRKIDV